MSLEFLNFLKNRKRKGNAVEVDSRLLADPETVPEYNEGYDSQEKKIIRLVSNKKPKKAYQVTGIDDVVSKNNWKGWVYLAPVIILVAIFLIYPLINTIFIAFTRDYNYSTGEYSGFTIDNFGIILGYKDYVNSAGVAVKQTMFIKYAIPNTFVITFVTVPISICLALIISVALNSIKWFQKFLQTVFFLPYVTNAVAIGMVFSVIFDDKGIINFLFNSDTVWIYGAKQWVAMIPLCLYIIWNSIPFKILVLLSGLQGIDKQYYQAAQIDGASKGKILMKITVPLLSPQILYLMITSFIGAFKEYTSIVAIFDGPSTRGTNSTDKNMLTVVYYVYEYLSKQTSWAAAAAVFLFVIILLFTIIQFVVSNKRVHY